MINDPQLTPAPSLDVAALFSKVNTIEQLARALATAAGRPPRTLSFVECMSEQVGTGARLTDELGPGAPAEFREWAIDHPALAYRAEASNISYQADFACAAVRAYRSGK